MQSKLTISASPVPYELAISLWKEWNDKINVISRKDSDFIFEHHILHSLCIAQYVARTYGPGFSGLVQKGGCDMAQSQDGIGQEDAGTGQVKARQFCGSQDGKPSKAVMQQGAVASNAQNCVAEMGQGSLAPNAQSEHQGLMQNFVAQQGLAQRCKPLSILDLGTGGGFPGIPLAMEWPHVKFTLCDSIGKKIKVASAVASGLGLSNVTCIQSRVEELKEEYDFVVSRAVAPLDQLYAWVGKKFRRSLICLKGGDVHAEIDSLRRRFGLSADRVRVLAISDFISDPYYCGKYVIEVLKGNF